MPVWKRSEEGDVLVDKWRPLALVRRCNDLVSRADFYTVSLVAGNNADRLVAAWHRKTGYAANPPVGGRFYDKQEALAYAETIVALTKETRNDLSYSTDDTFDAHAYGYTSAQGQGY